MKVNTIIWCIQEIEDMVFILQLLLLRYKWQQPWTTFSLKEFFGFHLISATFSMFSGCGIYLLLDKADNHSLTLHDYSRTVWIEKHLTGKSGVWHVIDVDSLQHNNLNSVHNIQSTFTILIPKTARYDTFPLSVVHFQFTCYVLKVKIFSLSYLRHTQRVFF